MAVGGTLSSTAVFKNPVSWNLNCSDQGLTTDLLQRNAFASMPDGEPIHSRLVSPKRRAGPRAERPKWPTQGVRLPAPPSRQQKSDVLFPFRRQYSTTRYS